MGIRRTLVALVTGLWFTALPTARAREARADTNPLRLDRPLFSFHGPAVLLGEGSRLVLLNPNDGAELGRAEPIAERDLHWVRFQTRGRFVLAEGVVGEPFRSRKRALALLEKDGKLRFTTTYELDTRASPHVFLNDDGVVVHDAAGGGRVIVASGTVTHKLSPLGSPLGPVIGTALPFGGIGEWSPSWLTGVTGSGDDRTITKVLASLPADSTEVTFSIGKKSLGLVRVLRSDIAPGAAPVEILGVVRLPALCASEPDSWTFEPTLADGQYLFDCAGGTAKYVFDATRARFARVPRQVEEVAPDGSYFAIGGNDAEGYLLHSRGGKPFTRVVTTECGARITSQPELACGHVFVSFGDGGHCSRVPPIANPIRSYVQQRNGSWLAMHHRMSVGACSGDERVAFFWGPKPRTELVIAWMDRDDHRVVLRAGADQHAPIAWLGI